MKHALYILVGITCLAAAPAFAEDNSKIPEPPKSATSTPADTRSYLPHAGLWDLQLDGPAFPIWQFTAVNLGYGPSNTVRGVGVTIPTATGTSAIPQVGIGGSLGYLVSDSVEVGGMLGFLVFAPSGGSLVGFNIEPYLKLHLGNSMMGSDSHINPFALIGFGLNVSAPSGGSTTTVLSPELAAGVEFMLTHSFGISVYIPITASFATSGGSAVIGLGLGYGLVGYF